jgi:hypothetical protein
MNNKKIATTIGIVIFLLVAGTYFETLNTPNTQANTSELGVCLHLYQFNTNTTELLEQINSKWIRIDWIPNQMDNVINIIKGNGIKILAILDHNTMTFADPPNLNFSLSQWATTVQSIMETDAAKKVDAWEIWNEPNVEKFQLGYMNGNPQNYADMLKSASLAIKSVSNASLIAAGLSPDYPNSTNPNWKTWLIDFNATSSQSFFDFQGVHLYDDLITNSHILSQTEDIMKKGVWITEIGQPSAPSPYSNQDQSSYLFSNFQMLSETNNPVFWYQLKDETAGSPEKENHFGLFDAQNNPKDASIVFTAFTSKP